MDIFRRAGCKVSNISNLQQLKEVSLINTHDKKYLAFFKLMGEKIYQVCSLEEKLNDEYFKEKDFEELLKENHEQFRQ